MFNSHATESVRPDGRTTGRLLAAMTLLFGAAGALTLPSGQVTDVGFVIVAVAVCTTLPVSVICLQHRPMSKTDGKHFVIYADLGVSAVLVSFSSAAIALPGCTLFVIVAFFCAVGASRRVVVGHLGFSVLFTALISGAAFAEGADYWIVAARFTIHVALFSTAAFLSFYIDGLRRRAERGLRDPLTGLWNRRGLYYAVEAARDQFDEGDTHLEVIVVDVNGFKSINDRYGHSAGDAALVDIAEHLTAVAPSSAVARLGGDEFVLVHRPGADSVDTGRLAAMLDRTANDPPLTVSTGVARGHLNAGSSSSVIRQLIASADVEMYKNKRGDALT